MSSSRSNILFTVVNGTRHSINGESHRITFTVPLSLHVYWDILFVQAVSFRKGNIVLTSFDRFVDFRLIDLFLECKIDISLKYRGGGNFPICLHCTRLSGF